MLLALVWWAILLNEKNESIRDLSIQVLQEQKNQAFGVQGYQIEGSPEYNAIVSKYERKTKMIYGEGFVFGITMLIGMFLIHRSFSREIDAADQQKNFLLSITHELKSPLTSIKLALQTFIKRKPSSEIVSDLSESALQESNRLGKLIDDLLLSTKMESGNIMKFEAIDMKQMVQIKAKEFKHSRPDKTLNLAVDSSQNLISGDPDAIDSVISNLLENATKYAPESEIGMRLYNEGKKIIFEIADQGPGIPKAEKKKIVRKFYRMGSEDTRKTKGTGLGLYIVNRIVESHRGKLQIVDNQPKGSIFRITLPCA